MTDFPDLKIKALVSFPASVYGGAGITVSYASGNYTITTDYSKFAVLPVAPAGSYTLVYNPLTGVYGLAPGAVGPAGPAGPVGPTGPAGSGDVVGPAGAVNNNIAVFDLATGKLIKDGGTSIAAAAGAVRFDAAQTLTATQQKQARSNSGVDDRNILINGDFRVNQMAYASAAALAAGIYGHDQWKAGASGGDYSFAQLKSSTQITIASGKSIIQPIEDASVVGGSYVLSWTGTAQARAGVNTLTPSGAYASSPLLITGQAAGTVMSVEFNAGTLGTVKLESGSSATPFIMRPFDQELMACKRYYCRVEGTGVSALTSNTTSFFLLGQFSIEMRAPANATLLKTVWSAAGFEISAAGVWVSAASASLTTSAASKKSFALQMQGFSALTAFAVAFVNVASDILAFDARL